MSEKAKAKKIKGDPGLFWPDWVKLPGLPAGEKKKLLILGSLLCLGVVFMLWSGKPGALDSPPLVPAEEKIPRPENRGGYWEKKEMETELAAALSRIKGVGRVRVDIMPAGTAREHWLYRETIEERVTGEENTGMTREQRILKEPVFRRGSGGTEEPILVVKEAPTVAGVLVVAEGAEDPVTCRRLWEATATVLGIPVHRVMVLPWGE